MTTESELIKRYEGYQKQNPDTKITLEGFRKLDRVLVDEEKAIVEEIYK